MICVDHTIWVMLIGLDSHEPTCKLHSLGLCINAQFAQAPLARLEIRFHYTRDGQSGSSGGVPRCFDFLDIECDARMEEDVTLEPPEYKLPLIRISFGRFDRINAFSRPSLFFYLSGASTVKYFVVFGYVGGRRRRWLAGVVGLLVRESFETATNTY